MLRLKEIRKERGLTQEALASRVGVSQGCISGIESGTYLPGLGLLIKLAKELDCTLNDLVDTETVSSAS